MMKDAKNVGGLVLGTLMAFTAFGCGPEVDEDGDGDGYSATVDCNDANPTIFPNADEVPYNDVDEDCDGVALYDVDGDGFDGVEGGGDDCDDTNPDINPGAAEIPGDPEGLDENCDGVIILDEDGDGFPPDTDCDDSDPNTYPGSEYIDEDRPGTDFNCDGDGDDDGYLPDEDCDDADPDIHPGAEDIPYNGIDEDCSGADDIDKDDDGYDSAEFGGDDCDDERDDISPEAEEVPYNGLDDDCVDGDLEDVDGDGSRAVIVGGDDCDDTRGDIFPGAAEIPYDSIDQDCDGVDLIDPDGDGFCPEGVAPGVCTFEGLDCDDSDANIHPGLLDWADGDGINRDCDPLGADGLTLLSPFVPLLPGDVEAAHQGTWMAQGDINGDGTLDFIAGSAGGIESGESGELIVPRIKIWLGPVAPWAGIEDSPDIYLWGRHSSRLGQVGAVLDLNNDGVMDLALGAPGAADHEGRVYIIFGREEGGLTALSGQAVEDVADLELRPNDSGVRFGSAMDSGDLNNDGLTDLLIGAPADGLAGGEFGFHGAVYRLYGATENGEDIGTVWPRVEGDLLISELPLGDEASRGDVCYGPKADSRFGQSLAVGDLNGDDLADIVAAAPKSINKNTPGGVFIWMGGAEGSDAFCGGGTTLSGGPLVPGNGLILTKPLPGGSQADSIPLLGLDILNAEGETPRLALLSQRENDPEAPNAMGTELLILEGHGDEMPWPTSLDLDPSTVPEEGPGALLIRSGATPLGFGYYRGNALFMGAEPLRLSLSFGDITGDGSADLLLGEPSNNQGAAWLFGGAEALSQWGSTLTLADTLGELRGVDSSALAGDSVYMGDLDGDGRQELLVAAPGGPAEGELAASGEIFVFRGE